MAALGMLVARGASRLPATAWQPFVYAGATIAGRHYDRAAIITTARLNGERVALQVDTGADVTLVDDRRLEAHAPVSAPRYVRCSVAVGSTVRRLRCAIRRYVAASEHSLQSPLVGTLGLDMVAGRALALDLGHHRLALLDDADTLPNVSWFPAIVRDGKFFVSVRAAGHSYADLFLDTGSAIAPLITTRTRFEQLTGHDPSAAKGRFSVTAFGQRLDIVSAPLRGDFTVAGIRLHHPAVYAVLAGPRDADVEHYPFPCGGIVGLAPFGDRTIVLDLGRSRFGVMEKTTAYARPLSAR